MHFEIMTKALKGQKSINNHVKKYKNKKVIIYGAGQYSQYLFKNFDMTGLNIIAVADKKYPKDSKEKFFTYKTISPDEIKYTDYDVILIALWEDYPAYKFLVENGIKKSKTDILIKPDIADMIEYKIKQIFHIYTESKNDKNQIK